MKIAWPRSCGRSIVHAYCNVFDSSNLESDKRAFTTMELQRLRDQEHLELIREMENAVIYKHGPMCWAGMVAHRHLKHFATRHPDIPVFFLDAVAQRPLARHIANVFGIRHESPQAIFLVDGEPVWNDSHYRLTTSALERVTEDRRKLASDSTSGDRGQ